MTPLGGFFELELDKNGAPYHTQALALASGRACLRRILEHVRPRKVWTPFYVCDSVLQTMKNAGVAMALYAIDASLDPVLPPGTPAAGELALYVNYFGLKGSTAAAIAARCGERAVVDDTQAFFQQGYRGAWSFNSARKFFGVPDGAFVYGPGRLADSVREPAQVYYDHLVNRLLGHQQLAFEQYRASEACVSDEPIRMSALASRLLANVNYDAARRARRENFARLHEQLGARNGLALANGAAAGGPYCYPLLTDAPVPWTSLWGRGVFAPRLWPEVEARQADGFAWERRLAAHVLPLPIDHRYGAADMDHLVNVVAEVMAW